MLPRVDAIDYESPIVTWVVAPLVSRVPVSRRLKERQETTPAGANLRFRDGQLERGGAHGLFGEG